jgi:hypothetical protein
LGEHTASMVTGSVGSSDFGLPATGTNISSRLSSISDISIAWVWSCGDSISASVRTLPERQISQIGRQLHLSPTSQSFTGTMAGYGCEIGTLVERTTGYTMLVHLPDGYKPAQIAPALAAKIQTLPVALRGSLTWDQWCGDA